MESNTIADSSESRRFKKYQKQAKQKLKMSIEMLESVSKAVLYVGLAGTAFFGYSMLMSEQGSYEEKFTGTLGAMMALLTPYCTGTNSPQLASSYKYPTTKELATISLSLLSILMALTGAGYFVWRQTTFNKSGDSFTALFNDT